MNEKHEIALRRKAVRLTFKGVKVAVIFQVVRRSRGWLAKWTARFEKFGSTGLKSQSRRPRHSPQQYSSWLVRQVVSARRRLLKRKVGLIGTGAIQRGLRPFLGTTHLPSPTKIYRILREHGLVQRPEAVTRPYFPAPTEAVGRGVFAMDWTCRYLEGGTKVYAFHTLDLQFRTCYQTIATDKSGQTVRAHVVGVWKTLGFPQFLQLDNDAAFCGGYKAPRIIGQFVRLCLYIGVELIFLPVAEPEHNGDVERLNGLWAKAFWQRRHFRSLHHVQRASPEFEEWYHRHYEPPKLLGQTPAQAQRSARRSKLTASQARSLPDKLPITAGRIHFIRKVNAQGRINILNEEWSVGKRLGGRYVWATLITITRRLDIYYRRSFQAPWRLVKSVRYEIDETVTYLKTDFKRS
jgi:putative transposase